MSDFLDELIISYIMTAGYLVLLMLWLLCPYVHLQPSNRNSRAPHTHQTCSYAAIFYPFNLWAFPLLFYTLHRYNIWILRNRRHILFMHKSILLSHIIRGQAEKQWLHTDPWCTCTARSNHSLHLLTHYDTKNCTKNPYSPNRDRS